MRYTVYILTNWNKTVLYTGVTNDLLRRLSDHKIARPKSFTGRYHARFLLYYEEYDSVVSAIAREKAIKNLSRARKLTLIQDVNPNMRFLNV